MTSTARDDLDFDEDDYGQIRPALTAGQLAFLALIAALILALLRRLRRLRRNRT